ncbi:MAG: sensor histidine kinase [Vicinamibacterales bacterium]
MSEAPPDPRWPTLLSLSVHELRTPMTVVSGYIRMLLKDRAGPLSEPQRKLLQEAEKSCGRLSELLSEASDLAQLEDGRVVVGRQQADVIEALRAAVDRLPPLSDRTVEIHVDVESGAAPIHGDPTRLAQALSAVVAALRRELVTEDPLIVRERKRRIDDRVVYEIAIGDPATIGAFDEAEGRALTVFDEWRGGCGLSLPVARRVIAALGGQLSSTPDGRKTAALIRLPALS